MTDAGQGLALKGADEVGGAQEDTTIVARSDHGEQPPSDWPQQPSGGESP